MLHPIPSIVFLKNMDSSSSVSFASGIKAYYCNCGLQASLRTSWTERNPGRCFFRLPKIWCKIAIEGRHQDWQSCFGSLGFPKKPVLDCYISGNGTKIVQKYAEESAHLNPPHTFVLWVVVNNQPLQESTEVQLEVRGVQFLFSADVIADFLHCPGPRPLLPAVSLMDEKRTSEQDLWMLMTGKTSAVVGSIIKQSEFNTFWQILHLIWTPNVDGRTHSTECPFTRAQCMLLLASRHG
ncbi:hypothetical protein CJ030_MR8G016495 [Morella rubra]|uniref:Uncharacterized protein n=1 Tax=Morella rubra TaxID=262757 RepID=A0A6A1UW99_9ROSI|nr:hypothetical protein CJ030_MR8G016495 [Morella rubra]